MSFRLVDTGWLRVLEDAVAADHSAIRIVCPFIKTRTAKRLLASGRPQCLHVVTRFNLSDFCDGVSDIDALALLLDHGARIRGVRNLHAKLYLFGDRRVLLTSANLTEAALQRNHELGVVSEDDIVIRPCREYFDDLWGRAGEDLRPERLNAWKKRLDAIVACGSRPSSRAGLTDDGVDVGFSPPPMSGASPGVAQASSAFVKFFSESDKRAVRTLSVLEEVDSSECHWACTFPKGKRPRQFEDGSLVFMAKLVKDPNDIVVYGRAIGIRHKEGRDDATPSDIARRPWKALWPHYIRVHDAEFLAGTLVNGVSLSRLMDELGSNAFESTKKNATKGEGNTDPRRAYSQQAAVRLSI